MSRLISLCLLHLLWRICSPCEVKIEGETSSGEHMPRSRASDEMTLRLEEGEKMEVTIFITENCTLKYEDFCYSNDGYADELEFLFDDHSLGKYRIKNAVYGGGHEWNKIKCSGEVGASLHLHNGTHEIVVAGVDVDYHGVEIDYIILNMRCLNNNGTLENANCPTSLYQITQTSNDGSNSGSDDDKSSGNPSGFEYVILIFVGIFMIFWCFVIWLLLIMKIFSYCV